MIKKLTIDDQEHFLNFTKSCSDTFQDFYITKNRQRIFINSLEIIKELLSTQKCYGWFAQDLLGIMIVYEEKGYRSYVKILTTYDEVCKAFLTYLGFNYHEDLFLKIKKISPQVKIAQKLGYQFSGGRGKELLLLKKGDK